MYFFSFSKVRIAVFELPECAWSGCACHAVWLFHVRHGSRSLRWDRGGGVSAVEIINHFLHKWSGAFDFIYWSDADALFLNFGHDLEQHISHLPWKINLVIPGGEFHFFGGTPPTALQIQSSSRRECTDMRIGLRRRPPKPRTTTPHSADLMT